MRREWLLIASLFYIPLILIMGLVVWLFAPKAVAPEAEYQRNPCVATCGELGRVWVAEDVNKCYCAPYRVPSKAREL